MPNKNYNRGRAYENRICAKLKKDGWTIAQRSAGSHSPVDIWAVDIPNKKIKLIQCKTGRTKETEKKNFRALPLLIDLHGYFFVEVDVV